MERIRFITHNAKRILLIDCSSCNSREIAQIADHVPDFVTSEPEGTVLLLADFTQSELTRESIERIKIAAVHNRRHLKRSAWVVTDSLSKKFHDVVEIFSTREIPVFSTREEALKDLTTGDIEQPVASTA